MKPIKVLIACCLCLTASSHAAEPTRPNIVLILADDLGAECLRSYGGTSYDSALLDKLATEGMRFTNCYSQPICTPSRVKLMTGRSNARNYRSFGELSPQEITFGQIMKSAGYRTAIAGKWQLSGGKRGRDNPDWGSTPESSGFGESCMWAYVHNLPAGVQHTGGWERPGVTSRYWHPSILQNNRYRPTQAEDYGPDIYTDFLLSFIERNQTEPFFVYYPMTLTHGPFLPTPHSKDLASADKFKNNRRYFGDMISYTGYCVDRIVRKLNELQLAENTLLIFIADNGTHRSLVSRAANQTIPGGKGLPIDSGVHVPMIAYWKGKIQPGSTCKELIDFSDFLPTLAAVGNAELLQDRQLDGQSFLPLLGGEQGNPRDSVFVHYDKDPASAKPQFPRVRFAYDGRYKLYQDGRLFDVPSDWNEVSPLKGSTTTPSIGETRTSLQQVLDAMPAWDPDNSSFSPEQYKRRQRRK